MISLDNFPFPKPTIYSMTVDVALMATMEKAKIAKRPPKRFLRLVMIAIRVVALRGCIKINMMLQGDITKFLNTNRTLFTLHIISVFYLQVPIMYYYNPLACA